MATRLSIDWGEDVHFIDNVLNPFPLIQQADVLLICSHSEAFGRVTVEAMQIGIPVIGAASGGTLELVKPHYNGLLYESTVEDLAEKMGYLIENQDEKNKMGENARSWSEEMFSQDKYMSKIAEVLGKIEKNTTGI